MPDGGVERLCGSELNGEYPRAADENRIDKQANGEYGFSDDSVCRLEIGRRSNEYPDSCTDRACIVDFAGNCVIVAYLLFLCHFVSLAHFVLYRFDLLCCVWVGYF